MKTNQMMEVNIGGFTLPIGHKTQMGSLNALWAYGNGLRNAKGLSEIRLDNYLSSPDTIEFLLAVEKRYGTGYSKSLESRELEKRGFCYLHARGIHPCPEYCSPCQRHDRNR